MTMRRGSEPYSDRQKIVLAYIPKIPALLSLFGYCWILVEVLRDKRKQASVYHRLMLGVACYGIFFSICTFLGTWPIPSDTVPEKYRPPGASGTTATCTAQGFFIQIGTCYNFYTAALAIYYVLVVRCNWKKDRLIKYEIICHVAIAVFAITTSIAGIFLKLYNNALFWCWIHHYPYGCDVTDGIECTRGVNATGYMIFFGYVYRAIVWIIIVVSMGLLYQMARKQAKKMKQYAAGSNQAEHNLNEVTKLALSYLAVFIGFNFFFLLFRTMEIASILIPFSVTLLAVLLAPLTGFGFTLIYLRPRFEKYVRRQHSSGKWKWSSISKVFQWSGVSDDDHKLCVHEDQED